MTLLGVLGKRVGSVVHRLPRLSDIERVENDLNVVPLALTEDGNPPKDWLLEHGQTRHCSACERGLFHGVKYSVGCPKRYRAWADEQRADLPALPELVKLILLLRMLFRISLRSVEIRNDFMLSPRLGSV